MAWAQRAQSGELPCKALIPNYDLSTLLIDKSRMTEILMDSGIVPRSVNIDPGITDLSELETTLRISILD